MKNKIRLFLGLILGVVSLPFVGLGLYDFIEIRPKLPAINAILQNASPQDRNPPMLIRQLIDISEPRIEYLAVQPIMWDFYTHSPQSEQALHQALWQILLPLHFKHDELYGIFASTARMQAYYAKPESEKGLNNFALQRFNKPLDQLSMQQSAMTVAMSHSPTSYQKDPQRLEMRTKWLLEKLNYHNANLKN